MGDIQSMTGFARADGAASGIHIAWELRSVNGKGLDIRFRLPTGLDRLEPLARKQMQAAFQRGNIQAALTVDQSGAGAIGRINAAAFLAAASELQKLAREAGLPEPEPAAVLLIKGVVDTGPGADDDETQQTIDSLVLSVLDTAIESLATARRSEGAALTAVLTRQLDGIGTVVDRVAADPSRSREQIREKLRRQVEDLLAATAQLDDQRLHAEAALLAVKADIQEEIDRLSGHLAAARALVDSGGAVGRRLDFLAQEFNREANTLCSKSNAASVTDCGLELKTLIDQMREQIQNIE